MRRHALPIGAALAAAATIVYFAAGDSSAPTGATSEPATPVFAAPRPSVDPSSHASSGRSWGCRFSADDRLAYEVEVVTRAERSDAPGAARRSFELEQRAAFQLHFETLRPTSDEGAVLLARIARLEASAIDGAHRLLAPFVLRVGEDCAIEAFGRHEDTLRADARIQQSLSAELGFVWPETDRVSAERMDALGAFTATFEPAGDASARQVLRRVTRYDRFWQPAELAAAPVASHAVIELGQGPFFADLESTLELRGDGGFTRTRVSARALASSGSVMRGAARELDAYVWENLLPRTFERRAGRPITLADRRRQDAVRQHTYPQTLASYLGRVERDVGFQDTWPPLTDYLEARPEAAARLVRSMRDGELPTNATAGAYVALSRTRTAEALGVLREVMHDEAAPSFERTRAMFALIDRDDVDVSDAQYMASKAAAITSDEPSERILAREAMLAVGAIAGQHPSDDAIGGVAENAIMDGLATAEEPLDLRPVFGAIGNMRSPRTLSLVVGFTESPEPEVRQYTSRALRRMDPLDTTPLVVEWLGRERHPRVLRSLYRVLDRAHLDAGVAPSDALVERAVRDLRTQPDRITRVALIRLLGRAADRSPEARAALVAQIPVETEWFRRGRDQSAYDILHRVLQRGGHWPSSHGGDGADR